MTSPYSLSRPGGVQGQVLGLARALHERIRPVATHTRSAILPLDDDLVLAGLVERDAVVGSGQRRRKRRLARISSTRPAARLPRPRRGSVPGALNAGVLLPALGCGVRAPAAGDRDLSAGLMNEHPRSGFAAARRAWTARRSPVTDDPANGEWPCGPAAIEGRRRVGAREARPLRRGERGHNDKQRAKASPEHERPRG